MRSSMRLNGLGGASHNAQCELGSRGDVGASRESLRALVSRASAAPHSEVVRGDASASLETVSTCVPRSLSTLGELVRVDVAAAHDPESEVVRGDPAASLEAVSTWFSAPRIEAARVVRAASEAEREFAFGPTFASAHSTSGSRVTTSQFSAAWLGVCLALFTAACSRFDSTKAYRYACSRDAGADDCPGGWVCSLDGVCVDPSAPAPLRCRVTADCTGGWVCAKAGVCLDPAVGAAHACDSEADCTGGWHCGPASVCYDRALVRAVACRAAVPNDCAPGWRCGLEGACHDRDAGAPYQCSTDSDCERAWRCDVGNVCVDVAADALRATDSMFDVRDLQQVGPKGQAPRMVAFSPQRYERGACSRSSLTALAMAEVLPGVLERLDVYFNFGKPLSCTDAGTPSRTIAAERFSMPWTAPTPVSMVVTPRATYVLDADGGFLMFQGLDAGQLVPVQTFGSPGFMPKSVRPGSGVFDPMLLAFDDTRVALFHEPSASWIGTVTPNIVDAGQRPLINDVALLGADCSSGENCSNGTAMHQLVLGTNMGLFAAENQLVAVPTVPDAGGFSPISAPWNECWRSNVTRILQTPNDQSITVISSDTRLPQFTSILSTQTVSGTVGCEALPVYSGGNLAGYYGTPGNVSRQREPTSYYACGGQPEGLEFISANTFRRGSTVQLESRCAPVDGGAPVLIYQGATEPASSSEVRRAEVFWPQSLKNPARIDGGVTSSPANPLGRVLTDSAGRMWWSLSDMRATPAFPHSVPDVVGGRGNSVFAVELQSGTNADDDVEPTGGFFTRTPFGFVNADDESLVHIASSAVGRPEWITFVQRDLGAFVFERTSSIFSEFRWIGSVPQFQSGSSPVRSAAARASTGNWVMLVTGFDTIHALEVTTTFAFDEVNNSPSAITNLPKLAPVMVPLPSRAVTSLIALGPSPDVTARARYLEGYLTSAGRVFRYRADNPVVWRTDEIELDGEGEVVRVFNDGRRVRVGFRDGKVYALPSRTRVGPSLVSNASVVLDFADVCGSTFALTRGGLKRLTVQPNGTGLWTDVALPGVNVVSDGRLHSADGELTVWVEGRVLSLTASSCEAER